MNKSLFSTSPFTVFVVVIVVLMLEQGGTHATGTFGGQRTTCSNHSFYHVAPKKSNSIIGLGGKHLYRPITISLIDILGLWSEFQPLGTAPGFYTKNTSDCLWAERIVNVLRQSLPYSPNWPRTFGLPLSASDIPGLQVRIVILLVWSL